MNDKDKKNKKKTGENECLVQTLNTFNATSLLTTNLRRLLSLHAISVNTAWLDCTIAQLIIRSDMLLVWTGENYF